MKERLPSLYQAEWCPHSHRVRERPTELGVDFVARQVPPERERRATLLTATGSDRIPVLVLENGTAIAGSAEIVAYLERRCADHPDEAGHRRKAEEHHPCREPDAAPAGTHLVGAA